MAVPAPERAADAANQVQNGFRTAVAILALALFGALFFSSHAEFIDERAHSNFVRIVLKHNFDPNAIAADPKAHETRMAYYYTMAAFSKVTGESGLAALRIYTVLISLVSAWVFYRISKITRPEARHLNVLQYWLLPVLFPYFYMVYTDVPALLFMLLALWAALRGGAGRIAVAALCSALVRPHAVAWLPFLGLVSCAAAGAGAGAGEAAGTAGAAAHKKVKSILKHAARHWALFAILGLFVAFVIWNKGVTANDREHHPIGFYTANIWFSLFVIFAMFLPLHLANLLKIGERLLARPGVWIAAVTGAFILYMITFENTHPYNQVDRAFFFRNWILIQVFSSPYSKALFFVPIAWAAMSLVVTRLGRREFYWIYPFAALSLAPEWMIEHRYAFVLLVFFMLFRQTYSKKTEIALLIYFAVISACFAYRLNYHVFFL